MVIIIGNVCKYFGWKQNKDCWSSVFFTCTWFEVETKRQISDRRDMVNIFLLQQLVLISLTLLDKRILPTPDCQRMPAPRQNFVDTVKQT